jgi:bacillithiol system protein YtxJ
MEWLHLSSEDQLEEINQRSFDPQLMGVLLFKHSTRCSISSAALNRLERNWKLSNETFPAFYLDLLNNRLLSMKIADYYSIEHQSPQVLVIKNGKCIYSTSHSDINADDIVSSTKNQ